MSQTNKEFFQESKEIILRINETASLNEPGNKYNRWMYSEIYILIYIAIK